MKSFVLILVAFFAAAQAARSTVSRLSSKDCEGTTCPQGCCEFENWHCCADGHYCASKPESCPQYPKIKSPLRVRKLQEVSEQKACEGTTCPQGCCEFENWHCCADGHYCASKPESCPQYPKIKSPLTVRKLQEVSEQKACEETTCPQGCCEFENWHCCADGHYCASKPESCPQYPKIKSPLTLMKLQEVSEQKACEGTTCPQGCCEFENWHCCADGHYCASKPESCPQYPKIKSPLRVRKLQEVSEQKACEGTTCPQGCCEFENWHCCADGHYCASKPESCPQYPKIKSPLRVRKLQEVSEQKACEGTTCPQGCCEFENWHCCADGHYCASKPESCPQYPLFN